MEPISNLYLEGPCGLESDFRFFRGADGRPYRILALHCLQTYAFSPLMYGVPTRKVNEEALHAIRERCAKLGPAPNDSHPVHFEKPPLILMEHPDPELEKIGERLPKYFVVVDVESNGIAEDDDCDFSSLRCVYFFDRFAPVTLMEEIERRTVALPWEELARAWSP